MPKISLSPLQGAMLDMAGREHARDKAEVDKQSKALSDLAKKIDDRLVKAISVVLSEHKLPLPDARVSVDRDQDGQPVTMYWDDPAPAPEEDKAKIIPFPNEAPKQEG